MTDPISSRWDDVQLMAWADGVLAPEQAAALERDIAQDAALAQRAALMMTTRPLVREAYDARLNAAPVPDALRDTVQAMVAQDRARRAQAQASTRPASAPRAAATTAHWRTALARLFSSFALPGAVAASVMFGGLGYVIGRSEAPSSPTGSALAAGAVAPAALAALLDRLPSGDAGQLDGRELRVMASFRDAQQRLCRDFSLIQSGASPLESVACRAADGRWQVAFAALAPADSSFTPAGSGSAVETYLAAIGAGKALDANAERAALAGE